jgi:ABC-type polysaccharide/polyol phosphate export permease
MLQDILSDQGSAYGNSARTAAALIDLREGLRAWPIWTALSWLDVRQRYRRSALGPFWITISMAVLVSTLGVLYAGLFQQDPSTMLPHIAAGFLVWGLFSATVAESTNAFVGAEGLIRHGGLPLSLHIYRVLFRNILTSAHNLVVMLPIYIWQPQLISWLLPLSLLGAVLAAAALFPTAAMLAILGTRFRDLHPIVVNVLQILLFVSPILYEHGALPPAVRPIADLNPMTYLIDVIRAPMLGTLPSPHVYGVLVAITLAAWLGAFALFRVARPRIAYWL